MSTAQHSPGGLPLVTVCLITYNHAPFVAQAIDGILRQRVGFPWELVIADDCSTDGTREILLEYQRTHPELIRLILQPTNVGAARNWHELLGAPRGRYIAYCEGDDYWTDEFKLQKQIDFLEQHSDYVLCFSKGIIENQLLKTRTLAPLRSGDISIIDLVHNNDQLSATSVYRALPAVARPPLWILEFPFGDLILYLWLLHTTKLRAHCIDDVTVVYRIHPSGSYSSLHDSPQKNIVRHQRHVRFYLLLQKHLLHEGFTPEIHQELLTRFALLNKLYLETHQYHRALANVVAVIRHTGHLRPAYWHLEELVKSSGRLLFSWFGLRRTRANEG